VNGCSLPRRCNARNVYFSLKVNIQPLPLREILASHQGKLPSEFSLTLFLSAVFEVILELLLRIKLRSAHRALVRLARFMFF
jgi:hypothetical protein